MSGVENSVEGMKGQFGEFLKYYPPFPPGSEERIKLLRGYVGFRKLIDQLTFPPPEGPKVGVETSKAPSPVDSIPNTNQTGETTYGNV